MKTKFDFTQGEWVAALLLLAIILCSYLFYFLYDTERPPLLDAKEYMAEFEAFNVRQEQLRDSIERARDASSAFYRNHYRQYDDTLPGKGKRPKKPLYDIVRIDLNRCDSTDILVVPMFGSKRAARLVEYRDKLGGFYSLSQLQEVYVLQGIPEDLLQKYFVIYPEAVRKLNVNTATYKEMSQHPYFDAYLTKTIIAYREKSGGIHSFEELQRVTHAYPELMDKLRHYVVFE
ncbi:MAG: helix-hairpin-helix domain-containing protein [Bacteroidales bacterium]|nr:helix-hairpin-helix domain-containing protein [Bacteroidales bacterium]